MGIYQGTAKADGYALTDGTPLTISEKDQKWEKWRKIGKESRSNEA
jgi:dTDP-4-dehydrorhamnose 3,5-epimerase